MGAFSFNRRACAALVVSALTLTLAATALAAHPKKGRRYTGFTSEPKIQGFAAPVSFTVSAAGTKLLSFRYGSLGCFGAGGFRPGVNPFTGNLVTNVGSIHVAANGHFGVAGATSSYRFRGEVKGSLTTTVQVSGRFVSARRASGTITFTQTERVVHQKPLSCGPAHFTFKVKPS